MKVYSQLHECTKNTTLRVHLTNCICIGIEKEVHAWCSFQAIQFNFWQMGLRIAIHVHKLCIQFDSLGHYGINGELHAF